MHKVFITRRIPKIAISMLRERYSVTEIDKNEPYPYSLLKQVVEDYDGILCTISEKLNASILSHCKRLKVISNYAVGLDNIDIEYARDVGIEVCNTPDAVTNSTADLTIGLLLALIRRIPEAKEFVQLNRWTKWDPYLLLGEELANKKLGILGFGRCGQAVARRAIGFGLNVKFFDRTKQKVKSEELAGVNYEEFESILSTSDYLSVHLPLTEATRSLIDMRAFKLMQKKPILINMARGDIIDNDSMLIALENQLIRGAVLDVVAKEPIAGSHPLCKYQNVLVVPHIGTATVESREQMAIASAQNIINVLERST